MIGTLPAPCWTLKWEGYPLTSTGTHYETEQDARRESNGGQLARHKNCGGAILFGISTWCPVCEADVSSNDWELLTWTPAQLPAPCWVLSCDCGDCDPGDIFDVNGDGYGYHQDTEPAAYALAWNIRWKVTPAGHAYTDACDLPPGTVLAPPPGAAREAAGQLTLIPAR